MLTQADDGISGMNFKRPGLNALLDEVKAGNVATVIFKDQSRIGRDVIEVGLLKRTFDEYNVRYIAANDNLDSANGFNIMAMFKDVFNEYHVAETSEKIRAVFKSRMEKGLRCSGSVPYGYLKDPNDKNKLIVDPEPAEVVKRIYQLVMDGKGIKIIADILSDDGVLIPAAYAEQNCPENRHCKTYHNPTRWSTQTITHILEKREYIGDTVLGKTISESYKTKKKRKAKPEELKIFEGTHEAIIDPEMWHNVQRLRQSKKRPRKNKAPPCHLSGLLFCADCGKRLTFRYQPPKEGKNKNEILAYSCSSYRQLHNTCTMHYIGVPVVENLILSAIRKTCAYVRDYESEFVQQIIQVSKDKQSETIRELKRKISRDTARISELDGLVKKLYESFASGSIPEKHFKKLVTSYDEEQAKLETDIAEMQKELDNFTADNIKVDKFIALVKRSTIFTELTTSMLNEFVEKIIVHEGNQGKGKDRIQKVDIHFNFIGDFVTPVNFITEYEIEEQQRQEEEQAAKAKRKKERQKANTEIAKQRNKDFTARKKAGQLTPGEQEQDKEKRRIINEKSRAKRAEQRALQPPKPLTKNQIIKRHYAGLPLTDEEFAVYRAWQDKKTEQAKARRHKIKAETPPKLPRILQKDVVEKYKNGFELTAEEQEVYNDFIVKEKARNKINNDKKRLNPEHCEKQRVYMREYKRKKKAELAG